VFEQSLGLLRLGDALVEFVELFLRVSSPHHSPGGVCA
jgi:hypothetical protein